MNRFAAIKSERAKPGAAPPDRIASAPASKAAARLGKKAVSGYFSLEASRALHLLALEQGLSLQALMGEAFDDLLRKYGKHPLGER